MPEDDTEIEALTKSAWQELPSHYRRAVLRRAKSDLWWDEAFQKLRRHQALFVVVVGLVGAASMLREYISEIAQWVADTTKGAEK